MFSGKGLLAYFVFVFGFAYIPSLGAAAVPQKMNFQGRLTDISGVSITGSESIVFSIWDAVTVGSSLWSETQTVQISSGIYNVSLGDVTAISSTVFSSPDRWLQIKVGSDAAMTPRVKLLTAPYAHVAETARFADGHSLIVVKPIDESIVNDSTLQDDDHLKFVMEANTTYLFEIAAWVGLSQCTVTPWRLRATIDGPAGLTRLYATLYKYTPSGSVSVSTYFDGYNQESSLNFGCSTGTRYSYEIKGSITNGSTAGPLVFRWAQGTADAATTYTVKAGSYLKAIKVP